MSRVKAKRAIGQADRQHKYRCDLNERRRPNRNNVAQAALLWLVSSTLARNNWREINFLEETLLRELIRVGFDKKESDEVLEELFSKYGSGWDFRRKRYLEDVPPVETTR
jgi:hypothetical protein